MNEPSNTSNARFGSMIACGALVVASLVTGAIAFESRHLPTTTTGETLIAVGVAFLPALSTFVVSFFKLFAPASRSHDQWLWFCVGLDLIALLLQGMGVAAREIGRDDNVLYMLNLASYAAAAISALAIAIAAGTSDHRLAHVDEAERKRAVEKARLKERLQLIASDPEVRAAMVDAEKGEILSGLQYLRPTISRAMPPPDSQPDRATQENGNRQHADFR